MNKRSKRSVSQGKKIAFTAKHRRRDSSTRPVTRKMGVQVDAGGRRRDLWVTLDPKACVILFRVTYGRTVETLAVQHGLHMAIAGRMASAIAPAHKQRRG